MYSEILNVPTTMKETTAITLKHFNDNYRDVSPEIMKKRNLLSKYIEEFHGDAGTLTPMVREKIDILKNKNCMFLMTGHQPEFIACYSVFKKPAYLHVCGKKLQEASATPVVEFCGIADQDMAHAWRWLYTAQLPNVKAGSGCLNLIYDFPKGYYSKLLYSVPKPSMDLYSSWKREIREWASSNLAHIEKRNGKFSNQQKNELFGNFEEFIIILDESYNQASNFADFNAFLWSKIVNNVWGYDTLFARFSECQQIFADEFSFLLSNHETYFDSLKQAKMDNKGKSTENIAPFWYHCDCNGKVELISYIKGKNILLNGECPDCNENINLVFDKNAIAEYMDAISSRISARGISMPLVFFNSLGASFYVAGGLSVKEYLPETKFISDNLGLPFPGCGVWGIRDHYLGLGQLCAYLYFNSIEPSKTSIENKIDGLGSKIKELDARSIGLEKEKNQLRQKIRHEPHNRSKLIEEIKRIDSETGRIKTGYRRHFDTDLATLKNISNAMSIKPSIADHAINIGLDKTNEQWIRHLYEVGDLTSDLYLDSVIGRREEVSGFDKNIGGSV